MILLALLSVSTRTVKWCVCAVRGGSGHKERGVVTRGGVWSQGKGCGHKERGVVTRG